MINVFRWSTTANNVGPVVDRVPAERRIHMATEELSNFQPFCQGSPQVLPPAAICTPSVTLRFSI